MIITADLHLLGILLEAALDDPMSAKIVLGKKRAGTDLVRALDHVKDEIERREGP